MFNSQECLYGDFAFLTKHDMKNVFFVACPNYCFNLKGMELKMKNSTIDPPTKVCYENFGAIGDGVTDDFLAIQKAHDYANEHGLPVVSNSAATYYIGNTIGTAVIKTDTNWGMSRFIIDDSQVKPEDRQANIFEVRSAYSPFALDIPSIKKSQTSLNLKEDIKQNIFAVAVNENVKRFVRQGLNQSPGEPQTDCFILDGSGVILTPVIWDFDEITSLTAYPIDERILTVKGGIFTTVANQAESKYTYYGRGIVVTRSNVVVDGVVHSVTGELDHGAPYRGFFAASDCAYVTFQNCYMTGHKIYKTIGSAGLPVNMGSYDISLFRSIAVSFINCKQDNIMDTTLWGVFGSNYCKDIVIDNCILSRVDAHMGVENLTVKNSTIGWMGIKAIGWGHLLIENVSIFCKEAVEFRPDYGSRWDGELTIRNVKWYPALDSSGFTPEFAAASSRRRSIIFCENSGGRDFGYTCALPKRITIENFCVMDANMGEGYDGMSIFYVSPSSNQNLQSFDEAAEHPYYFTQELNLRGLSTQSGKGFALWSDYPANGYCHTAHSVKDGAVDKANFRAQVDGIDRLVITSPDELAVNYGKNHRLVPKIEVRNCEVLEHKAGVAPMLVELK